MYYAGCLLGYSNKVLKRVLFVLFLFLYFFFTLRYTYTVHSPCYCGTNVLRKGKKASSVRPFYLPPFHVTIRLSPSFHTAVSHEKYVTFRAVSLALLLSILPPLSHLFSLLFYCKLSKDT